MIGTMFRRVVSLKNKQSKRNKGAALGSWAMEVAAREDEDTEVVALSLVSVCDANIHLLRTLNASLFPIHYQQRYYAHVLSSGAFSKLAFAGNTCVGSITCRVERTLTGKRVNILTLGVLAPYRRSGIGSKLMHNIMELCHQDEDIYEIYLHVQVNNDDALHFYRKFGFQIRDRIQNYYKRIDPPDCYILFKDLTRDVTLEVNGVLD